jgi:hypothetical protein
MVRSGLEIILCKRFSQRQTDVADTADADSFIVHVGCPGYFRRISRPRFTPLKWA